MRAIGSRTGVCVIRIFPTPGIVTADYDKLCIFGRSSTLNAGGDARNLMGDNRFLLRVGNEPRK